MTPARGRGLFGFAMIASLACGTSHPGPVRCVDGTCPPRLICVTPETTGLASCVAPCDPSTSWRCENGALCLAHVGVGLGVCWPGGALSEGAATTNPRYCAFGLTSLPDYTAEPLRATCEPGCTTDSHCRAGDRCLRGICAVPCEGEGSTPCTTPNRCVLGQCVNERRFSRIDCNGDGEYVYLVGQDCPLPLFCDSSASSGCAQPEPGME